MAATLETDIVFVYGALRSGTTLFKVMLAAHEGIANPGETDFLFDHLTPDPGHPTGWRYDRTALAEDRIFRDRALVLPEGKDGLDLLADLLAQISAAAPGRVVTLNVHRHAERLRAILPAARILHLLRDPRDVARSAIVMGWAGNLWYGVMPWVHTEQSWDRAAAGLAPGQVLTLTYETLFEDLEGSLRRVCGFLGVPYSARMLDYHLNTSYGPPDASLAWQWRRRATPREIALVEGRAGSLMRARGYDLAGSGSVPGGLDRLGLALQNKVRIWQFGIRRFGLRVFLGEKLMRWLGFEEARRHLKRQMSAISRQYLK